MKSKVIIGGAAIVALAGGVMFCGDEEILTEEPTTEERVFDNEDPQPTTESAGALVSIEFDAANAAPVFWAVRTADGWSQPAKDDGKAELRVADRSAPYGVLWACEAKSADGNAAIHTTLVETTPADMATVHARCSTDGAKPIQVTGAIRNVNGQSATLFDGTSSTAVENDKAARDVLFTTTATEGKHTFAARVGDDNKAKFAVARDVDVKEGTAVEIDAASGAILHSKMWKFDADDNTETRFGEASVWMDGRTRVYDAGVQIEESALITRTTNNEADFVDLRADLAGESKNAQMSVRYMARANRDGALPLPELTFAGPSYAWVDHVGFNVSWSRRNWAVFGQDGDKFAFFWPIAHVASVEASSSNFRFDLVVTPMRVGGETPFFKMPKLAEIQGWEDRFWISEGAKVSVKAGNLSAYAGADAPDTSASIAAYLDSDFSPVEIGANDIFAVVVAGAVTVMHQADKDFVNAVETRCIDFRGCEANDKPGPPVPGAMEEWAKSVQACPDLEAFADCEAVEELPGEPPRFTVDLQREIARYYTKADFAGAVDLNEALEASKAENVKPVSLPERGNIQVFSHADTTRPDSGATWYGAYLNGRLISLHPVNLDVKLK